MATAHRAATAGQLGASSSQGCDNPKECSVALPRMKGESRRLDQAGGTSAASPTCMLMVGLEALDLLGVGLVVCNVFGQLLVANQTAEKLIASRDGLGLNADRVLSAVQPCSPQIEELVQRAASALLDKDIGCRDAALSVPRPSHQRPLTVLVRSLADASRPVNAAQPAALVLIMSSAAHVQAIAIELQQLYGLTSTEARLANLLIEGDTLDDCCDRLGICRSTGCTHLKRIFKKTGVRRQSELVALLLKSIGLARLGSARPAVQLVGTSSLRQSFHSESHAGRVTHPA